MPKGGRRFSFHLGPALHVENAEGPPVIPLSVGDDLMIEMIPAPREPQSIIAYPRVELLKRWRLLPVDIPAVPGARVMLRDLRILGHPVPDLEIEIGPAGVNIRNASGLLGRDFFSRFIVHDSDPTTRRLTLEVIDS